ncbi:hypothetical protein FRB97_004412 [Tulasnella sp. 331]|nr:hypothetical protein FRB97_004412 [Tulasnella sp. 331]
MSNLNTPSSPTTSTFGRKISRVFSNNFLAREEAPSAPSHAHSESGSWFHRRSNRPSASSTPLEVLKAEEPLVIPMPANIAELHAVLVDIQTRDSLEEAAKMELLDIVTRMYIGSLESARLPSLVTFFVLGDSGQGKSQTINRLVGERILDVGRDESTTKVIQKVTVPAVQSSISVALTFTDSPGLSDTTVADRARNQTALETFQRIFTEIDRSDEIEAMRKLLAGDASLSRVIPRLRSQAYPNVILLLAGWGTVRKDAQNDISDFVSPMGHAIRALEQLHLYDSQRPNIIFVVTRSLSDPRDYVESDDEKSSKFKKEWLAEAKKKEGFIHDLQQKVFPDTKPWPIVYVENEGKVNNFNTYRVLPNGEQTHANLFDAMLKLFATQDENRAQDMIGLHSLRTVVAGLPHIKDLKKEDMVIRNSDNEEIIKEFEFTLLPDSDTASDVPKSEKFDRAKRADKATKAFIKALQMLKLGVQIVGLLMSVGGTIAGIALGLQV